MNSIISSFSLGMGCLKIRGSPCALCVWLVADYDLKFYYAEFGFLPALGTVQRKIQQYGVLVNFDLASGPAFWAWQPERFFLKYFLHFLPSYDTFQETIRVLGC